MSIGIGDTVADVATGAKIGAIIDAAKEDVQRIIEQYQVGGGHGADSRATGSDVPAASTPAPVCLIIFKHHAMYGL
jgi:hypothetical protein